MSNQITFDILTEEYKLSQVDAQYIIDFIEDTKNGIRRPIILLFYGDGNNGKTHLLNRIQKEIGSNYVTYIPLEYRILYTFKTTATLLIDKKLAIIPELSNLDLSSIPNIADYLDGNPIWNYIDKYPVYDDKIQQSFTISTNFVTRSNSLDIFGNNKKLRKLPEKLRQQTKIIHFPHHF